MSATLELGIYQFTKTVNAQTPDERKLSEGRIIAIPHPMETFGSCCFGVDQISGDTKSLHVCNLRLLKVIQLTAPPETPLTMSADLRLVAGTWNKLNAAVKFFETQNTQQLSL